MYNAHHNYIHIVLSWFNNKKKVYHNVLVFLLDSIGIERKVFFQKKFQKKYIILFRFIKIPKFRSQRFLQKYFKNIITHQILPKWKLLCCPSSLYLLLSVICISHFGAFYEKHLRQKSEWQTNMQKLVDHLCITTWVL